MSQDLIPAETSAAGRDDDLDARFEKIYRSGALRPGEYWRAKVDQKQDNWTIDKGDVLLVADVRMDGDLEHRVDLIPPPSCGREAMKQRIRILVGDFEENWEPALDADAVRAREIAEIQMRAQQIQDEIVEAQTNPAYLNSQVLKAITKEAQQNPEKVSVPARLGDVTVLNVLNVESPSLSDALSQNAPVMIQHTLDLVRDAHQIAEAQGTWFAEKARAVGETMSKIVPYYEEKAQVAIARTSRAIKRAKTLLESVATLTLFTGEDIEVLQVRHGAPAPADAKIHLYQRKLWADEECSFFREYLSNAIDCTSEEEFHEAIAKLPGLVDQMVPMPRSVVLCGLTRSDRLYGDNPIVNYLMRRRNTRSFLIVRDGERVFIVLSPVESHEQAKRLFPEKDLDGSIFKRVDGRQITPEDLIWTDRLDAVRRQAIHYRRYLVLLAGLVSRETIWSGVHYADLFEAAKTDDLFTLIRDDSGEGVIEDGRPTVKAFVAENKTMARAGSRLIVDLNACITDDSAPHCYAGNGRGDRYRRVRIHDPIQEVELEREGNDLLFRCKVRHNWQDKDIPIKVRMFSKGSWIRMDEGVGWLCVDRLDVQALDRLMMSRAERADYIRYMALFRSARDRAAAVAQDEAPLRSWLIEQLLAANLAASHEHAVDLAVEGMTAWRAGGLALPQMASPEMSTLLDRIFKQTERGRIAIADLEPAAAAAGIAPLRLVLGAKGAIRLYAVPRDPDNRGAPQYEVDRWAVVRKKAGLSFEPLAPAALAAVNAEETVLHEWNEAPSFKRTGLLPVRLSEKRRIIDFAVENEGLAARLFAGPVAGLEAEGFFDDYARAVKAYVDQHRRMPEMDLNFPIGIVTHGGKTFVSWLSDRVERIIGRNFEPSYRERVMGLYRTCHARDGWLSRISNLVNEPSSLDNIQLRLTLLNHYKPSLIDHRDGYGYTNRLAAPGKSESATPFATFERISAAGGKVVITSQQNSRDPVASHVWFVPGLDLTETSPLMSWLMRGAQPPGK